MHHPGPAGTAEAVTPLWYFAYGSNLCRATFVERRGMRPLATRPARLDGFRLTFDLPVGPGERGVANLLADPDASVWGVCYQLACDACEILDRTEGVHMGYYGRLDIEPITRDGLRLPAFAYHGAKRVVGRKPSARYLGLLLEGAREHGLPAEWIATLEAFELAVDERRTSG